MPYVNQVYCILIQDSFNPSIKFELQILNSVPSAECAHNQIRCATNAAIIPLSSLND